MSSFPLMEPSSQLEENAARQTDVNEPTATGSLRSEYINDHQQVATALNLKGA